MQQINVRKGEVTAVFSLLERLHRKISERPNCKLNLAVITKKQKTKQMLF